MQAEKKSGKRIVTVRKRSPTRSESEGDSVSEEDVKKSKKKKREKKKQESSAEESGSESDDKHKKKHRHHHRKEKVLKSVSHYYSQVPNRYSPYLLNFEHITTASPEPY